MSSPYPYTLGERNHQPDSGPCSTLQNPCHSISYVALASGSTSSR